MRCSHAMIALLLLDESVITLIEVFPILSSSHSDKAGFSGGRSVNRSPAITIPTYPTCPYRKAAFASFRREVRRQPNVLLPYSLSLDK